MKNIPVGKKKFGRRDEFNHSDFQSTSRDYAFVIDNNQNVGEILSYIRNLDKKLIKSVELFDIYSGDKLESGKKSVALSVQIQANDRTLTETDLNLLSEAIIFGVSQKFTAKLRD
jgi:phenylalanyl-tRNA synthetase beta chain